MRLFTWPKNERPREKLINYGAAALSDCELLAILLQKGIKGQHVMAMAQELLKTFNGPRGLFETDYARMKKIPGIGLAKFCQIQAAAELYRRHLQSQLSIGIKLPTSLAVKNYLIAHLRSFQQEVFACLFLDSQFQLIHFEKLFFGSISWTAIYPREVAKKALLYNAAAVIVAHNHPSGDSKPSKADFITTRRLKQALALIDVQLLDHLIVGEGEVVSISETQGW